MPLQIPLTVLRLETPSREPQPTEPERRTPEIPEHPQTPGAPEKEIPEQPYTPGEQPSIPPGEGEPTWAGAEDPTPTAVDTDETWSGDNTTEIGPFEGEDD
ncbi:MAG TPA: hypothetical protein VEI97_01465 [bacterium]|nr:hypothetical protein [bacterium]